jgi:uncharacterized protein YkwD
MLRRPTLLVAVLCLCAALLPAGAAARPRPRPAACEAAHIAVISRATIHRAQDATLCLLNRIRVRYGLAPLRLNRRLSHAARGHSREMVRRRYFSHDSPGGAPAFARMLHTHYVPRNAGWMFGENIAWGGGSLAQPAAIVRAWMHSPPHRENILNRRFRDIGIGIAAGVPVRGRFAHLRGATYTTDFGNHS